jgi:hypothetical protein
MKIKGTAIKSTQEFVRSNFYDQYEAWLAALPDESREIYTSPVFIGNWYPLKEGVLKPTEVIGEMFYDGDIEKAGYETGKDSALRALKGVYKIFVKMASVDFVLKRAKSIFSTYYDEGKFEIVESSKDMNIFKVYGFSAEDKLINSRIAGWIEGIFLLVSSRKIKTEYYIEGEENIKPTFVIKVKFT